MKAHTLYLEEMYTKNAEFPEEGKFTLKDDVLYTHYTVCGDADDCEGTPPGADVIPPQQPGPSHPSSSFTSGWSIPHPWASVYSQKVNPLSRPKKNVPAYNAAALKRTFPYVSLCLDHTGKNITVESTIDSIYVKIPQNSVCVSGILEEVAMRVGMPAEDFVLLDAKFVPVSNDERGSSGLYTVGGSVCVVGVLLSSPDHERTLH